MVEVEAGACSVGVESAGGAVKSTVGSADGSATGGGVVVSGGAATGAAAAGVLSVGAAEVEDVVVSLRRLHICLKSTWAPMDVRKDQIRRRYLQLNSLVALTTPQSLIKHLFCDVTEPKTLPTTPMMLSDF